jgi:hypothetical protein
MKVCIKCNQIKPLSDFYKSKSYKDGKIGTCKSCFNIISSSNIEYRKQYKNKNKAKHNKQWRENNKEKIKQWRENNKEKINNYQKTKKQNNPLYKISACIRTKISQSLSKYSKSESTLKILGLNNFEEFKQHVELQFSEGMNWGNYGFGKNKWVIDHKIPLASALNEQEVYDLNHYTNLQPMWWEENIIKGAKIV